MRKGQRRPPAPVDSPFAGALFISVYGPEIAGQDGPEKNARPQAGKGALKHPLQAWFAMAPNQNRPRGPARGGSQYKDFDASELYCPRCRQAMPVRRRLLLVLPDGDLYEYLCARCGATVGQKTDRRGDRMRIIH